MAKSWNWSNKSKIRSINPRSKWKWSMPSRWKTISAKERLRTWENRSNIYNRQQCKPRNRRPLRMIRQFSQLTTNREVAWIANKTAFFPRMSVHIHGKFWKATRMPRVVEGLQVMELSQQRLGIISWLKVSISTLKLGNRFKLRHSSNSIKCTSSIANPKKRKLRLRNLSHQESLIQGTKTTFTISLWTKAKWPQML